MGKQKNYKDTCKWCGNTGHLEKGCKKQVQPNIFPKTAFICQRCGQRGHLENECQNDYKVVCKMCGIDGHEHWNCWRHKIRYY